MQIDTKVRVGALFKLVKHKGNPEEAVGETAWFHNIVLNSGLDRMSVGTWISGCTVSADSNDPMPTQTGFSSTIARTTVKVGNVTGGHNTTDPNNPYIFNKVQFRFSEGLAAGNISSLGMGWGINSLWNAARVKDAQGSPTTITVLEDEFLDVYCEIRFYPQLGFSGSFDLLDKYNNVVSSHDYEGTYFYGYFGNDSSLSNGAITLAAPRNGSSSSYCISSALANLASRSMTTAGVYNFVDPTTLNYPTARSLRGRIFADLNAAIGVHQSFQVGVSLWLRNNYASWGYKWNITPTITKTRTERAYYYLTISWDRYTP
ncbi:hypothetical protein MMO38_05290 [Acinetobacter sp. NIPH 1852]|uniref:hypothetical protein n=1 Tax=Acinetobacter sp. NIPH 1852 TaxID=2923428 RepID=UPI001F4A8187|nr:hypothetical protein [Acinetobacter sp. NIPH 1852]MCH7307560.1 hypothetical protein [Acinetobacter sp. NIPH 1852]